MRDNRYNKGIQTCQLKKKNGNITWQKKQRTTEKQTTIHKTPRKPPTKVFCIIKFNDVMYTLIKTLLFCLAMQIMHHLYFISNYLSHSI